MQKASPTKTFIPAPPTNNCACNDCPYMKLNSLEKIYTALKYEQPELLMSDELIIKSKKPIEKMLALSAKFGL
jgi:quinolinate synthase